MKIISLNGKSKTYTCNVYLITGTRKRLEDVNTLIDVGRDPSVIEEIGRASTGAGKQPVEQVVLTHSHYDHASLLPRIREVFKPKVYAFSPHLKGVNHLLRGGETLKIGDRLFEVIHMPGHSSDSICLYNQEDGALFAGDAPIVIRSAGNSHEDGFVRALEKLHRRDIRSIYFGHGAPVFKGGNEIIRSSLENVRKGLKKRR